MANAVFPTLLAQFRAAGGAWPVNPDLGVSKLVIVCMLVGLWQVVKYRSEPFRIIHLICVLPGLLGTLSASPAIAWSGLAFAAALFLAVMQHEPAKQAGLWIILIGAGHPPMTSVLGQIAGGTLLGLDRWAADALLSLFSGTDSLSGNALQIAGGNPVLLVWECGVFQNIPVALLFWMTMLTLLCGAGQGRRLADAALLALVCIAMNAARLALMTLHGDWFHILHDGAGAAGFRLMLLAFPLGLAYWRTRHVGS